MGEMTNRDYMRTWLLEYAGDGRSHRLIDILRAGQRNGFDPFDLHRVVQEECLRAPHSMRLRWHWRGLSPKKLGGTK